MYRGKPVWTFHPKAQKVTIGGNHWASGVRGGDCFAQHLDRVSILQEYLAVITIMLHFLLPLCPQFMPTGFLVRKP